MSEEKVGLDPGLHWRRTRPATPLYRDGEPLYRIGKPCQRIGDSDDCSARRHVDPARRDRTTLRHTRRTHVSDARTDRPCCRAARWNTKAPRPTKGVPAPPVIRLRWPRRDAGNGGWERCESELRGAHAPATARGRFGTARHHRAHRFGRIFRTISAAARRRVCRSCQNLCL